MMSNQAEELKARTKKFAVELVQLLRTLPKGTETSVIGRQLLKSGTSVAANYRAVCRARSRNEFVAKLGIVVEETDETVFWLEFVEEIGLVEKLRMSQLLQEAHELLAIFAASQRTAKFSNGTMSK